MSKQEAIRKSVQAMLILVTCVITQAAYAQPGGDDRGGRRGPPPEAYEACADLAAGDSCEMSGRKGDTLQGSCIVPKDKEGTLVCAQEGNPGDEGKSAPVAQ
jgi:hypothetical protein